MPWDFYRLTPAEFHKLTEGYVLRGRLSRERDAWLLANLLSPHAKKGRRIQPKDFLEESKPKLNANTDVGKAFMGALIDGKNTDKAVKEVKFKELMKHLKDKKDG